MGDGRFVACCVIKIQNKLKYNFSGRVSLLQVATIAGISTNWFENFQRFEWWRVNFSGPFPTEVENWFEFAGVSNNRGFDKSGVKSEANPRETKTSSNYRVVRETEGSRNRVMGSWFYWMLTINLYFWAENFLTTFPSFVRDSWNITDIVPAIFIQSFQLKRIEIFTAHSWLTHFFPARSWLAHFDPMLTAVECRRLTKA